MNTRGSSRFISDSKYFNKISELKVYCKHCGHSQTLYTDKTLCDWCNHYIYRDSKQEFKDRVLEKIRRV